VVQRNLSHILPIPFSDSRDNEATDILGEWALITYVNYYNYTKDSILFAMSALGSPLHWNISITG